MIAQKWEFGRTGGRREQLQCLEQLGRKEEERKEPYASAATVCISIAHREIPVLNCTFSTSAHNLFSTLVRRHNHLPCRHERALKLGEKSVQSRGKVKSIADGTNNPGQGTPPVQLQRDDPISSWLTGYLLLLC